MHVCVTEINWRCKYYVVVIVMCDVCDRDCALCEDDVSARSQLLGRFQRLPLRLSDRLQRPALQDRSVTPACPYMSFLKRSLHALIITEVV